MAGIGGFPLKVILGRTRLVRLRGGVPPLPFGERTGRCQARRGRHGRVSRRGPGKTQHMGTPSPGAAGTRR